MVSREHTLSVNSGEYQLQRVLPLPLLATVVLSQHSSATGIWYEPSHN